MDINELLDQLLENVNVESELDRRRAFLRLVEYADLNLDFPVYAIFLTTAAVRLKQEKLLSELAAPRFVPMERRKSISAMTRRKAFRSLPIPRAVCT